MKHTLILASFAAAVLSLGTLGLAQTPAAAPVAPSFIKGTLGITFNTVTQADNGKPAVGAADTYTFDINVSIAPSSDAPSSVSLGSLACSAPRSRRAP